MNVDLDLIHDLLLALSAAAPLTSIVGLQKILGYAAVLAQLGEQARERRTALLARVQSWVAESRGPTEAELDAMKVSRDELDAELAKLEIGLTPAAPSR